VLSDTVALEFKAIGEKQARAHAEVHRAHDCHEQTLTSMRDQSEDWQRKDRLFAEVHREHIEKQLVTLRESSEAVQQRHKYQQEEMMRHADAAHESLSASLESRLQEVSAMLSCEEEKRHDKFESRMSASIENILTQCPPQDDFKDTLRDMRLTSHAAVAEVRATAVAEGRAALEACKELAANTAKQFEDQRLHAAEHSRTLRGELEKGVSGIAAQLVGFREEAHRLVEREIASMRQKLGSHSAQQQSDIQMYRDALDSDIQAQARRLATSDTHVEAMIRQSVDSVMETLQARSDQARGVNDDLAVELRGAVAQAERRLQRLMDSKAETVDDMANAFTQMRGDTMRDLEKIQETVQLHTKAAKEDAQSAKALTHRFEAIIHGSQFQQSGAEVQEHAKTLSEIRSGLGSLTDGVMKIAQCVGLLGGLHEGQGTRPESMGASPPAICLKEERVGVKELLEWEQAGRSLASRVEKGWLARSAVKSTTLMDLLQRKADASSLKLVQMAVQDLDSRLCSQKAERIIDISYGDAPFVGSFGANARQAKLRPQSANPKVRAECLGSRFDVRGGQEEVEDLRDSWAPSAAAGDGMLCTPPYAGIAAPSKPAGMPPRADGPLHRRAVAPRDEGVPEPEIESPASRWA